MKRMNEEEEEEELCQCSATVVLYCVSFVMGGFGKIARYKGG